MNLIKEIIQGNPDEEYIHRRFIRYGRGEFQGPMIKIKNEGDILKISSSEEYVNSLGWIMTKDSSKEFSVSGSIISKEDISGYLRENSINVSKSAKKKGVYTLPVKGFIPAETLSKIYSEFPSQHIFLDLKPAEGKEGLKTKKKPPKPGSGADQKFCSAALDLSSLKTVMDEFCFDSNTGNFKEIEVSHKYVIKDIIIPEEYREDYSMARIHSKRKGVIERSLTIDGKKTESVHDFII